MDKELKLFVWEGLNVLEDQYCGMICVFANNIEEALKLIDEKDDIAKGSFPQDKYKIIKNPEAFICWGGG